MGTFGKELGITLRTLTRARGFTAAAVITLALGIGLAVSALAVVNAYLLRSLPYPEAERLYRITWSRPDQEQPEGLAELKWETLGDVIEHPIAWDLDMFYLTGGDHTEAAPGTWVTPGFMQGLGIRVATGRAFGAREYEPGAPQVALISDALWRTRFGGDPSVIGQRMQAYVSDRPSDPETFTIVGVLPADFWHLNPFTQILTPLKAPTYPYFVRLHENVPVEVATQRIEALVRASASAIPDGWALELVPVHESYVAGVKPMLLAVIVAVGLVLLMACANVALLVLLRGVRRQKEIAVRLALGAGRIAVARMLLLETMVIAVAAAATGTFVAWLVLRALAETIEQQLGARVPGGSSAIAIDSMVITAVMALTVVIALLLSLAPIAVTLRRTLFATLRSAKSSIAGGASARRTRYLLIGLEVAGSLALLVGSGLMVKTVIRMLDVEMGAEYRGVAVAPLAIRAQTYPEVAQRAALYARVLAAVETAPGATAVALSSPSPLTSYESQPMRTDDPSAPAQPATVRAVTPSYFAALRIALLAGRTLATGDDANAERVAVISESAARRLWPTANAIGQRIRLSERQVANTDTVPVERRVVGIAMDVRQSPTDSMTADVYVPLAQAPGRFPVVLARPTDPLVPWTAELRRAVALVDRDVAVNVPALLDVTVDRQLARPRFLASLFGAFGVFASLLGVIGLYSVIAYGVRQREHEIAIRMAVGAGAHAIVRLFLREGIVLLVIGLAAGAFGAIGLGRLLEAHLFGVATVDVHTLALATLALGAASLGAIWWPARRATRTDPIIALREE